MKILHNLFLHFARQDGEDRKKWKEKHATKETKIPKTKRQKYGMNKTLKLGFSLVTILKNNSPKLYRNDAHGTKT